MGSETLRTIGRTRKKGALSPRLFTGSRVVFFLIRLSVCSVGWSTMVRGVEGQCVTQMGWILYGSFCNGFVVLLCWWALFVGLVNLAFKCVCLFFGDMAGFVRWMSWCHRKRSRRYTCPVICNAVGRIGTVSGHLLVLGKLLLSESSMEATESMEARKGKVGVKRVAEWDSDPRCAKIVCQVRVVRCLFIFVCLSFLLVWDW